MFHVFTLWSVCFPGSLWTSILDVFKPRSLGFIDGCLSQRLRFHTQVLMIPRIVVDVNDLRLRTYKPLKFSRRFLRPILCVVAPIRLYTLLSSLKGQCFASSNLYAFTLCAMILRLMAIVFARIRFYTLLNGFWGKRFAPLCLDPLFPRYLLMFIFKQLVHSFDHLYPVILQIKVK